MLLIRHFTPMLVEREYQVLDPLNVTSVAPRGLIIFKPHEVEVDASIVKDVV